MIQTLQRLVQSEDLSVLVAFLKNLSPQERSEIANRMPKLWDAHNETSIGAMRHFADYDDIRTWQQSEIYQRYAAEHTRLQLVGFMCGGSSYLNEDLCRVIYRYRIFEWYCPRWLCGEDRYFDGHYYLQSICHQKGHRTATRDETATALARFDLFTTETIPPITLEEHLWYLFDRECGLHNPHEGKGDYWIETIVELANEQRISHQRAVEECLLSVTRFANKAVTGYFFRMLDALEPEEGELVALQPLLHLVLQSQHSKSVNQTLKYLKRIHKDPGFDLEGFMEQIPLLLSWKVKTIVNATLALVDVLIKAYPEEKEALALLATQALAQEDERLQTKTVKLLIKHKLLETQAILDEITLYTESLYHSTRQLLPAREAHPTGEETEDETTAITPPDPLHEENRIVDLERFEDMVFFVSSILDETEPYRFDLFAAQLPKLDRMITRDNADTIAPAIQRAYRYYIHWGVRERIDPELYFIVSSALLQFGWLLIRRLSDDFDDAKLSASLHTLFFNGFKSPRDAAFGSVVREEYERSPKTWGDFVKLLTSLQALAGHEIPPVDFDHLPGEASVLSLFKRQLQRAFQAITTRQPPRVPLSLPTHRSCFIAPEDFVRRVNAQGIPDDEEMEVALLRLVLDGADERLVDSIASQELRMLLYYLLGQSIDPLAHIEHPAWWLIAILRRRDGAALEAFVRLHGGRPIDVRAIFAVPFEVKTVQWEYEGWEKGRRVLQTMTDKKLKLTKEPFALNLPFASVFKRIYLPYLYGEIPMLDVVYGLYLMPQFPELYTVQFLEKIVQEWESAPVVRAAEHFTRHLIAIWRPFAPSVYLFVAVMMLYNSKTARGLTAELWYRATREGTMEHRLLGETLGRLEHNEYAPLKRLTDLIVTDMLNLSNLHNAGLHVLLSAMIARMNDVPIKGTKKLLEIYREVVSLSGLKVPEETARQLEKWGEVKSLTGVVKKVLKG